MPDGRGGRVVAVDLPAQLHAAAGVLGDVPIAWWIVSGWFAHSCSSRSPCSQAASGASLGKVVIGLSLSGLRAARP